MNINNANFAKVSYIYSYFNTINSKLNYLPYD